MIVPSTLKVVAVLSLYTADLFHDAIPYTYIDKKRNGLCVIFNE